MHFHTEDLSSLMLKSNRQNSFHEFSPEFKKCPKTLKPLVLVSVGKLIPPKLIPPASNQLFLVEEPLMLITPVMHRR